MTVGLLAILGCGLAPERGGAPVIPPEQKYLSAPDQTLPGAIVGEPYTAHVSVDGGDPPYTWLVADKGGLPGGLELTSEGTVTGTPTEAGTFAFTLLAEDSSGRSKRTIVSLTVLLDPLVARCGDRLRGTFQASANGSTGPNLDDLANLAWIAILRPEDDTTRVELQFTNETSATVYVERPDELPGSWDLEDDYVVKYLNPSQPTPTVPLDAGTNPSLTGYLTQDTIPVLLAATAGGDWQMDVVCTDGPIFEQLPQYPTELGQPIDIDYNVYGDNDGVRIWTEDPLPDWIVWDESTGVVSGIAEETGSWEFTVIAETADGRRREDRSILGVYDVKDAPCGSVSPLSVSEGYFDGDFIGYYDTNGYDVFRVPMDDPSISGVTLRLTGSDGHYLGLADPNPDWLKFYGGAQRVYLDGQDATITLGPRTYPSTHHYAAATEAFVSGGTIDTVTEGMTLHVTCDRRPQVDLGSLPVIEPLTEVNEPLPAIGGTPPYTWSSHDLPAGLTLTPTGVITGSTGATGVSPVHLTVSDRAGISTTAQYALYVGDEAACHHATQLSCDDAIDGRFTEPYTADGNGPDSTQILCIVDDRRNTYGLEVYSDDGELRVDVADPGVTTSEMFRSGNATYTTYVAKDGVDALPLDPYSWPDLDDYAGQRILIGLRAYTPGSWTAHLVCTPR